MLLHYFGKLKIQIFCRYSADMEKNANKLHLIYTDYNSATCVTVYSECIYVFLSKSCPRRWIPCWLLTNTAVVSAVTNFRCHKLIAMLNMWKTVTWRILFAISMGKTHYFKDWKYQNLSTDNKVRGDKNAICLQFLPYLLNNCRKFGFLPCEHMRGRSWES